MTGRTFEQSQKIREWISSALNAGAKTPAQVAEWIEARAGKDEEPPTLATISRIMREEMGYSREWKKGK